MQTRKPGRLGGLDAFDGVVEDALALHGESCFFSMPSRWTLKKKRVVGLEFVQPLLDEHAVGAEVDVLARSRISRDQLADLGIDHRLAAADADHRRAALVDRGQALFERQLLLDGGLVLADAAAAGAGQVAGVQRLEHQHEREALVDHRMRLAIGSSSPDLRMAGCGTDCDGSAHAARRSSATPAAAASCSWRCRPAMLAAIDSGNLMRLAVGASALHDSAHSASSGN